jgi:hypothetical protein
MYPQFTPLHAARFWSRVRFTDTCWLWQAGTCAGYGWFYFTKGTAEYTHRIVWWLTTQTAAGNMEVCHTCDIPTCVRPSHLFIGTQADNMRDMGSKARSRRSAAHHACKLSDSDVNLIRSMQSAAVSQHEIARRFGVNQSQISRIVRYKRRVHI